GFRILAYENTSLNLFLYLHIAHQHISDILHKTTRYQFDGTAGDATHRRAGVGVRRVRYSAYRCTRQHGAAHITSIQCQFGGTRAGFFKVEYISHHMELREIGVVDELIAVIVELRELLSDKILKGTAVELHHTTLHIEIDRAFLSRYGIHKNCSGGF